MKVWVVWARHNHAMEGDDVLAILREEPTPAKLEELAARSRFDATKRRPASRKHMTGGEWDIEVSVHDVE